MKTKIFTHTDLDGVGCAILASLYYSNVEIEYCDYDNINKRVEEFLWDEKQKRCKRVFITDISVNDRVAELIELKAKEKVILLDHHKTAEALNKYDWATVTEYDPDDGKPTCGTKMLSMYMFRNFTSFDSERSFVEAVRNYDTWMWKKRDFKLSGKLNDLLHFYGKEVFQDKMKTILYNYDIPLISDSDEQLLKTLNKNKEDYIKRKSRNVKEVIFIDDTRDLIAGVVFAERFQSELGDFICNQNPEISFAVIINADKSVSLRTNKENIDLSEIAHLFNGGGHPKASGFEIKENLKDSFIGELFNNGRTYIRDEV